MRNRSAVILPVFYPIRTSCPRDLFGLGRPVFQGYDLNRRNTFFLLLNVCCRCRPPSILSLNNPSHQAPVIKNRIPAILSFCINPAYLLPGCHLFGYAFTVDKDFNTPVLGATFAGVVSCNGSCFSIGCRHHTQRVDFLLCNKVSADRFSPALA